MGWEECEAHLGGCCCARRARVRALRWRARTLQAAAGVLRVTERHHAVLIAVEKDGRGVREHKRVRRHLLGHRQVAAKHRDATEVLAAAGARRRAAAAAAAAATATATAPRAPVV